MPGRRQPPNDPTPRSPIGGTVPVDRPPVEPARPAPSEPVDAVGADRLVAALRDPALARPFLPGLDLVEADAKALDALTAADRTQLVATKIADVTHFRVGLDTIKRHVSMARELAVVERVLPRQVRGLVVLPDGEPAVRVSVQPTLPGGGAVLGRGVVTDELGAFTLPLPEVTTDVRRVLLADGLGLRMTGAGNQRVALTVPVPASGRQALGELRLDAALRPLPQSVVGALIDLVDDLPAVTPGTSLVAGSQAPVRIQIGQDACNILFEEDVNLRRFPYKMLVRLVEPRTTTVNRVLTLPPVRLPGRPAVVAGRTMALPAFNTALSPILGATTRYVERVPVDKPISVDGFRDQLVGVRNNTIGPERTIPMAGTLGLGYVLNLAQVWKYDGLTLGNLLYSLPLAPGEQQRIAVSERTATASVVDTERLDMAEQQHSSLREDASTSAVFQSAFEEHVAASSSYRNEARSSSWGVAGGIGAVLGPVAFGIGAGGGGGKSSNNGSTRSALDGARSYTSQASEEMHRSVERQAAARRSASRTAIRLATTTERESVTTKVITNHNKMHALTIQYWEVLRKFVSTTEVEGCTLVCFVPLDLVRFLPVGQPLALTDLSVVADRARVLVRYAMLHRHADAIQPNLPGRHREGLRLLEDFAANPRSSVSLAGPAADAIAFTIGGTWIPYERVWVHVVLRGGRRLGPVMLDANLPPIPPKAFGTKEELLGELQRRRGAAPTPMSGTILLPQTVDPSEVVAFEIRRAFDAVTYQLDLEKHPTYVALKLLGSLTGGGVDLLGTIPTSATFTPAELEQQLGGPMVQGFAARLNGAPDSIAVDPIGSPQELSPAGLPIPAVERNPVLGYRDIMKIERTLQHVVRNTLTYSKAVWTSLTPEERVVMLEGYTIGLPDTGLDTDGLTDPSQHVPLLNCVANQVIGYYGNCMVMPFSIPASLAVRLNADSDADADRDDAEPLTTAAVQEALTQFHREGFSPPESHFTLPTRGVLGEAVLGHCASAEKIDLTRFWNWQDSPADEATAIQPPALRGGGVSGLAAPTSLTTIPSIVNNVGDGTAGLGALAQALAGKGPAATDFSTDFLGQSVLTALGGKTIESAEAARKDALGSATQLAGKALDAGVAVFKANKEAEAAKKAKEGEKAPGAAIDAAVKDLKDNAPSYLLGAGAAIGTGGPMGAALFAASKLFSLTGGAALPAEKAETLRAAYDKSENGVRTDASTAWLKALKLIP